MNEIIHFGEIRRSKQQSSNNIARVHLILMRDLCVPSHIVGFLLFGFYLIKLNCCACHNCQVIALKGSHMWPLDYLFSHIKQFRRVLFFAEYSNTLSVLLSLQFLIFPWLLLVLKWEKKYFTVRFIRNIDSMLWKMAIKMRKFILSWNVERASVAW